MNIEFKERPDAHGVIPSPECLAHWFWRQGKRNKKGVSPNTYNQKRPVYWVTHRTLLKAAGLPETPAAFYELQRRLMQRGDK